MLDYVVPLEADHPGFHDPEYRKRRDTIARLAPPIDSDGGPVRAEYTDAENATWRTAYEKLTALYPTHACRPFLAVHREIGYSPDKVPQLVDVSAYLSDKTGFRIQPVAGLVGPREFLGKLARRTFCATQYVRHHTRPLYTPEPDVIHELMGHAPMLGVKEFADLSQKIGEGSIGASDEQVVQLATLYWYTIEFGLLYEGGALRAYGAGLLSSFGELEHALSGQVEVRPFDPFEAAKTTYPITEYQPLLWSVSSIGEAFEKMGEFVRRM
jgi:phenylalanine-4-hydroxylase